LLNQEDIVMANLPLYGTISNCCQSPSLIVKSREGGFVTQNCLKCEKPRGLPFNQQPDLECGACGKTLEKFKDFSGNYAYRCNQGGNDFLLADIVPHWSERFDYHGYAIDYKYIDDYEKRRK